MCMYKIYILYLSRIEYLTRHWAVHFAPLQRDCDFQGGATVCKSVPRGSIIVVLRKLRNFFSQDIRTIRAEHF